MECSEFEAMLAEAKAAPGDGGRFERASLGYLEDTLAELENFASGGYGDDDYAEGPLLNPWRDIGRNDPCPCGSGKKFKKCCLVSE